MTAADEQILGALKERRSFLLDAGAGSGKTSSLINALNYIRGAERRRLYGNGQRVACITFTNVAKDEIRDRTEHDPLFEVSTIHDFLWGSIGSHQKELRTALLEFNAALPERSRRRKEPAELAKALPDVPRIIYSDRGANFLEGRIFHDDLLGIANIMFRSHWLLSAIVAAKFPFIFVDEYQDTAPEVVSILLDYIIKASSPPVIGFFGDKMQSIYAGGIGELPADKRAPLALIKKQENYRCSHAVIKLLNKIRSDIQQVPTGNNHAGAAVYVNLSGASPESDLAALALEKAKDRFGWEFEGGHKVLFLTHRLIARRAGYEGLWTAYSELGDFARDKFQSGEDPIISFFLTKLQPLIDAWANGRPGRAITLLAESGKVAASRDVKGKTSLALDELVKLAEGNSSIADVLKHLKRNELLPLLDDLDDAVSGKLKPCAPDTPEAKHQTFIATFLALPFKEFLNYRAVLEENLPYSTKHGVKGAQYDNVIVVLDDKGAKWNQYSFDNLLKGSDRIADRLTRTRNLFYVCCSRAKNRLIVAHAGDYSQTIEDLFGTDSVVTVEV